MFNCITGIFPIIIFIMNSRMRNLFWMAAVVLLAVFSSCSDDNKDGADEVVEAKLLTFGFYAEDNAGVLSKDYVATDISSTIKIAMPALINKSELVARFTTNEGNVVLIDGVTQVSGTTVNDFTVPVDYIVSNGKQNVKYTINVTKAANMSWKLMSKFAEKETYGGAVLKLNPVDNTPYLAFKLRDKDAADKQKMTVVKFDGGSWKYVGPSEGFSDGEVASSYLDLDFDVSGTPYVAFSDNSVTTVKGAASVMKWNGSVWSYVGNKGLIDAQSTYPHMSVLGDNDIILSQINNSNKVSFPRRAMVVSAYKGSWQNGELPLLASGSPVYTCDLAKANGAAYLLSINRGAVDGVNYGYSVFEYKNGTWSALLNNYLEPNATQTSIAGMDIAAFEDGTVYVLTGDDAAVKGDYRLRLRKYDPAKKEWSTVGGEHLNVPMDSHISYAVAVAPDGTPFVVYRDIKDQNYPKVIYLDDETKQWTDPVLLPDAVEASDLNIVFSSTGIGYISFTDEENHVLVYQYTE